MPRRNFYWLLGLTVVSLLSAAKVSRYGRVMSYALEQIDQRALEPVSQQSVFEGALDGMMTRLDDYSAYISPKTLGEFEETLDAHFSGVGVQILLDPQNGQLTVGSPVVGSPAFEAGVRAGDRILRIDGKSTQGLSLDDVRDRMRGEAGKPITLAILHQGETTPLDLKIVRREIQVSTVIGDTRNADGSWNYFIAGHDHLAYVRINSFSEKTEQELKQVLEGLLRQRMRGLVLDLRNNPGGLLRSAVGVCNLFIEPTAGDRGEIVRTRDRAGRTREVFFAQKGRALPHFPMAVLVNQFSASASEIVAACLQDHHRAVIVGQRSFGKGTVQELIDLEPNQGVMKLTTSSYWRPSNKNIHRRRDAAPGDDWGVLPDPGCEVKLEGKELGKLARWRQQRDIFQPKPGGPSSPPGKDDVSPDYTDPQMDRAIEAVSFQRSAFSDQRKR
jgi:carboxyl-terminal processing protease